MTPSQIRPGVAYATIKSDTWPAGTEVRYAGRMKTLGIDDSAPSDHAYFFRDRDDYLASIRLDNLRLAFESDRDDAGDPFGEDDLDEVPLDELIHEVASRLPPKTEIRVQSTLRASKVDATPAAGGEGDTRDADD